VENSLKLILTFQFVVFATIALDIPIARQVVVFVYTSFLPGLLMVKILRLNLKRKIDALLISIGLSIAFLMFVGLVVNELYPLLGISEPLSILPLVVTIGSIVLIMSFLHYKRCVSAPSLSPPSTKTVLRCLLVIAVPVLAFLGASLINSAILLLTILAIVTLVVATIFLRRVTPFELYPFVLLAIATSLLFHKEFISQYLIGYDVFGEIYVFRLTNINSLWSAALSTPAQALLNYNAMLSVTILPTIYSNLLNIQGEWIFKIVHLLLFSLVPISLYRTYNQRFGKSVAFLSVFYFILFPTFYGLTSRRQMIAELFFALSIFLIIDNSIESRKRQTLLVIFGAALVVSHYSISYIYLLYIFLTWLSMSLVEKHWFTRWNLKSRRAISGGLVLLFFVMTFSWYIYVSFSPAMTFFDFITKISNSLFLDFLNPETRGAVSEMINPDFASLSSLQLVDFVINKFSYFFILIGVVCLFKNYREKGSDWEYGLIALPSAFTVLALIVVPHLASAFKADRFYHVTLFYLAPVCILGGEAFFRWGLRPFTCAHRKPCKNITHIPTLNLRLMCLFLVAIFLFKVGFIYEIARDVPISTSISFNRMETSNDHQIKALFYNEYVPEQDVFSALWLSKMAVKDGKVYADQVAAQHVLTAYGMIVPQWKHYLSNSTTIDVEAYIYLRYLNVMGISLSQGNEIELTSFSHILNDANKIYSNGNSEIYQSFPGGE